MIEEEMIENERRRFFRINDSVGLSYRRIEAESDAHAGDDVAINIQHLLGSIDQELNAVINALWSQDPTVAKAIGILNKKINILSAKIIDDEFDAKNYQDQVIPVSLSACGVAFVAGDTLAKGQLIRLELTLKPSNVVLIATGKVINCEMINSKNQQLKNRIRVDFEDIAADMQEQLIQHIVQRQTKLISSGLV